MSEFQIAGRYISSKHPTYFLAEIGLNHNGNTKLAEAMIKAAHRAKAEGVKFQTFKAETLADPFKNPVLYEIFKKSELDEEAHYHLRRVCSEYGIDFISTPFDIESAEMLNECGVDAFKIASGDLTNFPLMKKIASFKKPVIFSTGMGFMEEVEKAISVLRENGADSILPLHCVSVYPPDDADLNLKSISTMREHLECEIGYSDHYIGEMAVYASIMLGACLIEKHFTLDKNLPGPDQRLAADEGEFRTIIQRTREIERMLGDGHKKPIGKEEAGRKAGRRGLYAAKDILPGAKISQKDIYIARPEGEMPVSMMDSILGMTVISRIYKGAAISRKNLEPSKVPAVADKIAIR